MREFAVLEAQKINIPEVDYSHNTLPMKSMTNQNIIHGGTRKHAWVLWLTGGHLIGHLGESISFLEMLAALFQIRDFNAENGPKKTTNFLFTAILWATLC